jgi:hypothetical protein
MTTEVTSIYDALVTVIGTTLLPNHKRLSNPYDLAQNNDQILERGWGLAVRAGTNTNRQIGAKLSVSRDFDISLTRKFFAREFDAVKKASTEKDLLEDMQLIIDNMEENSALDGGTYVVKYIGDSGIFNVRDSQDNFLAITVNVNIEYFRTIP